MNIVCLTEHVWFSLLVLFVADTPHCLPLGDRIVCVCAQSLSCVWLFGTPWTAAHQALLSMGFPRQEYWSGLPFPTPGDLPNTGIEPTSLASPASAGRLFITVPPGKPGWSEFTGQLESPQIKKKKKRNTLMPFAATGMDLEISILNQINQTKKVSYDSAHVWNLKKRYKWIYKA